MCDKLWDFYRFKETLHTASVDSMTTRVYDDELIILAENIGISLIGWK